MGRQENIEIFENTMSMCRIDPFLRSAIKESSGAQSLIPEGDWVELPMIQKGAAAKVVVSRRLRQGREARVRAEFRFGVQPRRRS